MTEVDLKKNMANRHWRLNNLYWIVNEKGQKVKFRCNYVQELLYTALHWLMIILKSRQHGITTFTCLMMLDMCLFNSNTSCGIIAHTLQAAKEIFRDKIKYPYDNLPEPLRNAIRAVKCTETHLVLSNNSSVITATSLRSGTYQWVHISEYGKICAKTPEKAIEIQSGTLETVHANAFVTIESTAEGRAGDFYNRCKAAERTKYSGKELGPMDYKFFFFPWYLDPKNTTNPQYIHVTPELTAYYTKIEAECDTKLDDGQRAWYAQKKESLGSLIYREHPSTPDEAFRASIEGAYYADVLEYLRKHGRISDKIQHNPSIPVYTVCDPGFHWPVWFFQMVGPDVAIIRAYEEVGLGVEGHAEKIKQIGQQFNYRYGGHYAPADLKNNNAYKAVAGKSLYEHAYENGWSITLLEPEYRVLEGIERTRQFLYRTWINETTCGDGVPALEGYCAKQLDSSDKDRPVFLDSPDDKYWGRHYADGIRYMSMVVKNQLTHSSSENTLTRDKIAELNAKYLRPVRI